MYANISGVLIHALQKGGVQSDSTPLFLEYQSLYAKQMAYMKLINGVHLG